MESQNTKSTGDQVCLSREQYDLLLEQAAYKGAQRALKDLGLADKEASNDIRVVRDLVRSLKMMQYTFIQTLVRWLVIGVLLLLITGIGVKLGSFLPSK